MWFFSKGKKSKEKKSQDEKHVKDKTILKSVLKSKMEKHEYQEVLSIFLEKFQSSEDKITLLMYGMDAAIEICSNFDELHENRKIIEITCKIAKIYLDWYYPNWEHIISKTGRQRAPSEVQADEGLDPLFVEAAKLVFRHQVASVSLLQRRLGIGYARAGRLIDQLEAVGIVEPFQGSKSRKVLIEKEDELDTILAKGGHSLLTYKDIQPRVQLFAQGIAACESTIEVVGDVDEFLNNVTLLFEAYLMLNPLRITTRLSSFAQKLMDRKPNYALAYVVKASVLNHKDSEDDKQYIDDLYFTALKKEPVSWIALRIICHNLLMTGLNEWFISPYYFKMLLMNFGDPTAKFHYGFINALYGLFIEIVTNVEGGSKVQLPPSEYVNLRSYIENFVQRNPQDARAYQLLGWVYAGALEHESATNAYKQAKSIDPSIHNYYPFPRLPENVRKQIWDITSSCLVKYEKLSGIVVNAYVMNNFAREPKLIIAFELNQDAYTKLPLTNKIQIKDEFLADLNAQHQQIENWTISWDAIHDNFEKIRMAFVYDINEGDWYLRMSDEVKKELEAERQREIEEEHLDRLNEIKEEIRDATEEAERRALKEDLRIRESQYASQSKAELPTSMKVAAFVAGAAAGHGLFKMAESIIKDFTGSDKQLKYEYKPGKFWA